MDELTQKQVEVRARIIARLRNDLFGPREPEEKITTSGNFLESPRSRYLTGIIYPKNTERDASEIDDIIQEARGDSLGTANSIPIINTTLPSSIGLSFFITPEEHNPISLSVDIEGGVYKYHDDDDPEKKYWQRFPIKLKEISIEIPWEQEPKDKDFIDLHNSGLDGYEIYYRWDTTSLQSSIAQTPLIQCTVVLVNKNTHDKDNKDIKHKLDEKSFFQSGFRIRAVAPSVIAPTPEVGIDSDNSQSRLNSLLYRDVKTFAKGHICAADWDLEENGDCQEIRTEWMPCQSVSDTNLDGNTSIKQEIDEKGYDGFGAKILSELPKEELRSLLSVIPDTYSGWISEQENTVQNNIEDRYKEVAEGQLKDTRNAEKRMRGSIDLICNDDSVLKSFRFANRSLEKQYFWVHKEHLEWRPFQLGFILVAVESVLKGDSNAREIMDLLWFPTGGGKTEAYLFLIACLLFYRRLEKESLDTSDGVAVITRYTLRALTTDQFTRTTGLICACELVRREEIGSMPTSSPFSVGLWIGRAATPNTLRGEEGAIFRGNVVDKVKQISECPCCHGEVNWKVNNMRPDQPIECSCENADCDLASGLEKIPVHTVDEQIYNVSPSVIIGTVDKFITITMKPEKTKSLFNLASENKPPDLIIQDELHLISGPLGSITGAFETTIDIGCKSEDGFLPKIIGSTATIQKAEEQIKSLFNRSTLTFPIPVSKAGETFFSETKLSSPGREYLGLSSAGRTATFIYSVAAGSLMQSRKDPSINSLDPQAVDPFTTLAVYFNSLRELGGARTHLQEDAVKAKDVFASIYGENAMQLTELTELTSNISQEELRKNLDKLKLSENDDGHIDVLLASSMISVGIDIPRLGLMMVQGQTKTMSEYIQATSRVGRGDTPGLILTIYNSYKVRDRSFFESFKTWHSSFYQHVEATSLTPFSARSRDKILPSLIVSLAYKLIDDMTEDDVELTPDRRVKIENTVMPIILDRVQAIDPEEHDSTQREILEFLEKWQERGRLRHLWNDYKDPTKSLLISFNRASVIRASGYNGSLMAISAPTSARDVEPTVKIGILDAE